MCLQVFRIILAFMVAGTLAFASTAYAGGDKYEGHFGDMDTNGDEIVNQEEFVAFFKDNADPAGAFTIIDQDSSGSLDHDEWHAFKSAHGYGHGGKEDAHEGHGHMDPHGKKSE